MAQVGRLACFRSGSPFWHLVCQVEETKRQNWVVGLCRACPTDYVSEDGQCHPRAALKNLLESWKECIPYMKAGNSRQHKVWRRVESQMGDLLEKLVTILEDWLSDDSLWEER